MEAESISQSAISAFESTFKSLIAGETGIISESTISPASDLLNLDNDIVPNITSDPTLLTQTVVLKLNGGLGTVWDSLC